MRPSFQDYQKRIPYYTQLPNLEVHLLLGHASRAQRREQHDKLDPDLIEPLGLLALSIEDLGNTVREVLVDILIQRDEYVRLRDHSFHVDSRSEDHFETVGTIRDISAECFLKTDQSIQLISNLWEMSALLMRTYYRFPIKLKTMSLWNLAKYLYDVGGFNELLSHMEFYVDVNRRGHSRGHYKQGGVLSRLKDYRNASVHMYWMRGPVITNTTVDLLGLPPFPIRWHDPVDDVEVELEIQNIGEFVSSAEGAYSHYVQGYGIIEARMLKDLVALR